MLMFSSILFMVNMFLKAKQWLESLRVYRVLPEVAENAWIGHHDNAPAHSSFNVQVFGEKTHFKDAATNQCGIASCDFVLIPKIKSHLWGTDEGGVKEELLPWSWTGYL